jgi:hypothetical protein
VLIERPLGPPVCGLNALLAVAFTRPSSTHSPRRLLLVFRGFLTRCGWNFLRKEFWILRKIHN